MRMILRACSASSRECLRWADLSPFTPTVTLLVRLFRTGEDALLCVCADGYVAAFRVHFLLSPQHICGEKTKNETSVLAPALLGTCMLAQSEPAQPIGGHITQKSNWKSYLFRNPTCQMTFDSFVLQSIVSISYHELISYKSEPYQRWDIKARVNAALGFLYVTLLSFMCHVSTDSIPHIFFCCEYVVSITIQPNNI